MATIYDSVILDESDLHQARVRKYFILRNAPYWEQQQNLAELNHEEEKRLNRIKSAQSRSLNISSLHPSENAQHVKQPKN